MHMIGLKLFHFAKENIIKFFKEKIKKNLYGSRSKEISNLKNILIKRVNAST